MLCRATVVLVALASTPVAESPRFAPAEGGEASKSFHVDTEFSLEVLEQETDGRTTELPSPVMEGTRSWRLEVTDRYAKSADGRPVRLEREIETAEAECSFEMEALGYTGEYGVQLESPLAGLDLVARLDEDSDEVVLAYPEDEEGEAELIEGLREDLDLRALLPDDEVEEGDSWEIEASALLDVLAPGGDLSFSPEDLVCTNTMLMEPIDVLAVTLVGSAAALDELEGDVTLAWRETKGGAAHIAIEIDVSGEADVTDEILRLAEKGGVDHGREDYHASVEREFTGEGALVWSLEEGRFESLALQLQEDDVVTLGYTVNGMALEFHVELAVESKVEHEAEGR